MVVKPVQFEEDDNKSNGLDKLDGLSSVANSGDKKINEEQKVQKKAQVQWSNQHAAIAGWFSTDGTELIQKHKEKVKSEKELGKKDIPLISILGEDYAKDSLDSFREEITANFYQLCLAGNFQEAATEFIKNTPTSLQSNIIGKFLETAGQEGKLDDRNIQEFLKLVVQSNIFQGREKDAIIQKLTGQDNSQLIQNIQFSLSKINDLVGKISKASGELFGTDNLDDLEKIIRQIGNPRLLSEFQSLKQIFSETDKILNGLEGDFAGGQISLSMLEENLNDLVLVLDGAVDKYVDAATAYKSSTQEDAKLKTVEYSLQRLQGSRDLRNKNVAVLVRKLYQNSGGKIVVKLDPVVYQLVNNSLEKLGEVKLSSMFCDRENITIDSAENLSFLKNSYELSNSQFFNNLNIVIRYIYSVFHKDLKEREKNKEELLAQLREIDKVLDEAHRKAVEFGKRLENKVQQERLGLFDINIAMYRNIIKSLEKGDGLKFITGKGESKSKILWYQDLLDLEDKRKIAQIILGMTAQVHV